MVKKQRLGVHWIKLAADKESGRLVRRDKDIEVPGQSEKIVKQISDYQLLLKKSIPRSWKEVDLCLTVDTMS
jgi:hypothetical protein